MTSNITVTTGAKAVEVVKEIPGQDPATHIVEPSLATTFYISEGDVMHIREVPVAAPVEPEAPQPLEPEAPAA